MHHDRQLDSDRRQHGQLMSRVVWPDLTGELTKASGEITELTAVPARSSSAASGVGGSARGAVAQVCSSVLTCSSTPHEGIVVTTSVRRATLCAGTSGGGGVVGPLLMDVVGHSLSTQRRTVHCLDVEPVLVEGHVGFGSLIVKLGFVGSHSGGVGVSWCRYRT